MSTGVCLEGRVVARVRNAPRLRTVCATREWIRCSRRRGGMVLHHSGFEGAVKDRAFHVEKPVLGCGVPVSAPPRGIAKIN